MKKLLIICWLIIGSSGLLLAQPALYVAFQPADFGLGVRGDYSIGRLPLYSSVSYGNWGLYKKFNLNPHIKLTQGVMMPLADYREAQFRLTGAINYHILHTPEVIDPILNRKIFNPLSFELGVTVYMGIFAIGCRTDILRWEPCVDVGIFFGKRDCYTQKSYKKKWKQRN